MPSDLVSVPVVRQMVKAAIDEALGRTRIPKILSGAVEDLDDDLDVAFIRMDHETLGSDPTQSDNWGSPGVIATTRLGEPQEGDQVRVQFDGPSGASALRTSSPNAVILPYGAETGTRIVIDGEAGIIAVYDDNDVLRAVFDPSGGIRFRSSDDVLVGILDELGHVIRDNATGNVTAEISGGSLVLRDPTGTDDIIIRTSSTAIPPPPVYRSSVEANPLTTLGSPVAPIFSADDYEIAHVAAFVTDVVQASTMTPPAGWTERADNVQNTGGDVATLTASLADRDPATGTAATFVSSHSNWHSAVGTRIVVRGGGPTSPSFRSSAVTTVGIAGGTTRSTVTADMPTGIAAGDILLAFVALGNKGGGVPSGWAVPPGWVFLGANFRIAGTGSNASTCAVGVWAKGATAADAATSTVSFTVTWGAGTKRVLIAAVAVQNPYAPPGGPDISIGGQSLGRGFVHRESRTAASGSVTAETSAIASTAFPVHVGRVYEVTYTTVLGASVAPTDAAITLRQGVAATGTIFGGGGRAHLPNTGTHTTGMTSGYFTPTVSGNIQLSLTIQSVAGGGLVSHRLTAAGDRWMLVKDIGSTDDINFAVPLTP